MLWIARVPATRIHICLQALVTTVIVVPRLLRQGKVQICLMQLSLIDLHRSMSLSPRRAFLSHRHNLSFFFCSLGEFRRHWHVVLAVDGFKHCGILIDLLNDGVYLLLTRHGTCFGRFEILVGRCRNRRRLLSLTCFPFDAL